MVRNHHTLYTCDAASIRYHRGINSLDIICFQYVFHFGVGRSEIEWNMKVKIEILICTGLMLNDHSNPYIESTTVFSDADQKDTNIYL